MPQEQKFFSALDRAAYSEPFHQVLKNFNSFPEHTFYLDVEKNEGIINLKLQIDHELKPMKLLKKDRPKFNPHVTLAFKDFKPEVCRYIIAEFKDRTFKRKFAVSGFSVYKHNGIRLQPFTEISLNLRQKNLSLYASLSSLKWHSNTKIILNKTIGIWRMGSIILVFKISSSRKQFADYPLFVTNKLWIF